MKPLRHFFASSHYQPNLARSFLYWPACTQAAACATVPSEVVADSSAGPPAKKRLTAAEIVKELADLSVLLGGGLVSSEKLTVSQQKLLSGA